MSVLQPRLLEADLPRSLKARRAGTFADNMKLPVHRWFRYSAGFSAEWAASEIRKRGRPNVFDPFAGSGTTLLAAQEMGTNALGQEAQPFVARIAQAKLAWRADPQEVRELADHIICSARARTPNRQFPDLLLSCYDGDSLARLESMRTALLDLQDDTPAWQLCWLAYVGILRATSHAGTAQWQYVLPSRRKAAPQEPFGAFELKVEQLLEDLDVMASHLRAPSATLFHEDAREGGHVPEDWAELVITSPPYANNYDYADATRLEMTMLGELEGWGELQSKVRTHLVRSCTQHVSPYASEAYGLLSTPELRAIADELAPVLHTLDAERFRHGGKKVYHAMVAYYFYDLARVWRQLRRAARDGAQVCFVVGDSAPYGIHVPVERWLGELALDAGFKAYSFEKVRDRNTKWKNRKHEVPLHEGRLWVNG